MPLFYCRRFFASIIYKYILIVLSEIYADGSCFKGTAFVNNFLHSSKRMSAELPSISEEASTSNASESQKSDLKNDKTFSRYRSLIITEVGLKITTSENYLKRLQNLRRELNYINETDWMYEPVDKKIVP